MLKKADDVVDFKKKNKFQISLKTGSIKKKRLKLYFTENAQITYNKYWNSRFNPIVCYPIQPGKILPFTIFQRSTH